MRQTLTTLPPRIHFNDKIELMGKEGREIYIVDKVYFFKCNPMNGKCVHDITIHYISYEKIIKKEYTITLYDVEYSDLVNRGYIKYLKSWNSILITPCLVSEECKDCKLIKIPKIN
jgi:hypothetical protein